jgi:regulator of microtubule dynamics protein 3
MPILWLLLSLAGTAQPEVNASLAQATLLRERLDESGALAKYREALLQDSTNLDALWNASYLATILGARDSLHHSPLMDLGRHLAEKSLQQWPEHAESHFALAVNLAMGLKHLPIRQKMSAAASLREEIRHTLELDPRHGGAWFLLGRWQYAYATLPTFEKMTAVVFLGGIPAEATLEKAEKSFRNALQAKPEEPLFHLDLARTLVAEGRKDEARKVLAYAIHLAPRSGDDPVNFAKMRALLKHLEG